MDDKQTAILAAQVQNWPEARRHSRNLALLEEPPLIDIEAASACNITCSFCPRSEMSRPARLMSEQTFAQVLALLPDNATVMFSGLGDSLLNPRLEQFVAALTERRISPCLITNGIRLTPERQQSLADAGLAQIQISVHGLDPGTLAPIVTRGANPARVLANLEHLAAWRPATLRVRLNLVETPDNAHARPAVRELADRLGFGFFYRRLHTRGGTVDSSRSSSSCSGCGIFGAVTFITVEGDVLPCVNDVRGEGRLGHVRDLSWPTLRERKRDVISQGAWFSACEHCNDDYRWVILAQGGVDEPENEGPI